MESYLYKLATDEARGFLAAIFKAGLFILSLIYGCFIRALAAFYLLRPRRLGCQVVSIGNITLGGTGKTSLVEFVAGYLKNQGHKVAVLSRGYKRQGGMGDEPLMLQKNLRDVMVLVDADRVRAAERAMRDYQADSLVLDDGFQQWRIKKDLEIVTIDSTDPFGNRQVLPRGILREPLSALKRADIFVLTKANLNPDTLDIADFLKQVNPRAAIFQAAHQPKGFCRLGSQETFGPEALKGKTAAIFCGIADPESFENLVSGLGIRVGLNFSFPDHYAYTKDDLEKIKTAAARKGIDTIITTEKDAARLEELGVRSSELGVFVLRIALKIVKDEEGFHERLSGLYRA